MLLFIRIINNIGVIYNNKSEQIANFAFGNKVKQIEYAVVRFENRR